MEDYCYLHVMVQSLRITQAYRLTIVWLLCGIQ